MYTFSVHYSQYATDGTLIELIERIKTDFFRVNPFDPLDPRAINDNLGRFCR